MWGHPCQVGPDGAHWASRGPGLPFGQTTLPWPAGARSRTCAQGGGRPNAATGGAQEAGAAPQVGAAADGQGLPEAAIADLWSWADRKPELL
eukprot:9883371-Lingulodinium_polyedra.AAC.1